MKNNLSSTHGNAGFETLMAIAKANAFNKWMFETIYPYCHGNILEIGSGVGNISKFFVHKNNSITLSDTDELYVKKLKELFPATNVLLLDLEYPGFSEKYKELSGIYDTVFLLNVLEHIKNDETAIQNCWHLLNGNGTMIILTPSYPTLYSKIDKELHHFRRYTLRSLKNKVSDNGFIIKKSFRFNALGIAGWLYAKLFMLKKIPSREMKIYNRLVWLAKFIDKIVFKKTGLSVIIIAQK
jgi:2-polyprenyl-3-methyl-5-hydroxy-6-metoxy-1,4-benzoquinol methylase